MNELQPVAPYPSPEDIVAEARRWLDTPYQHQGRTPHGLDCAGLCWVVYSSFRDIAPTDEAARRYLRIYPRKPDPPRMRQALNMMFTQVTKEVARPGDLLYLRFLRDPTHLGILTPLGGRGIIHAFSKPGRVVEHPLTDLWWNTMVVEVYRLKGT